MSSCKLERQPDAECLRGMNRSLHFSRLLTAIWHWYWMSALLILSPMVVCVGTPGSYASPSIPSSFSTHQKPPLSSEIQNTPGSVSSYSAWNPLQCDSCDHSFGGGEVKWEGPSQASPTPKQLQRMEIRHQSKLAQLYYQNRLCTGSHSSHRNCRKTHAMRATAPHPGLLQQQLCMYKGPAVPMHSGTTCNGAAALEKSLDTEPCSSGNVCLWLDMHCCLFDSSATVKVKIVIWGY